MLKQKQRGLYDCALASTASLAGVVYEDAFTPEWQAHIEEKKGTYGADIEKTFSMAGLACKHITNYFGKGDSDGTIAIRRHVINGLLWGRRALLQVPSINYESTSHLIVWNYDEVWDPSNLKVYTSLDDVVPEHIWILSERR